MDCIVVDLSFFSWKLEPIKFALIVIVIIRLRDESEGILVLEGGGGVGENLLARFIDFAKKMSSKSKLE